MTGEFTPAQVRFIFFEREGERCFRCRRSLRFEQRGWEWSLHHRQPRGMGGTKKPMSIANGLVLCGHATTPGGCHAWVESRRAMAEDLGYLIRREARIATPAGTPVRRLDGTLWLLRADGVAELLIEDEDEE
ncbi:hypothetical protein [Microbacterium sp. MYb64]|uniref:hypothetical protein n=1 Tax=Microbacterium sp. MYb64 TaxID=1848691 RepID=UPI000CFAC86F|nr:hypothetical protein [Microbacterium sp. MYb64]PRB01784.1 hypothetical protein CQ044_16690 [Microbacterium sp. MYb64]